MLSSSPSVGQYWSDCRAKHVVALERINGRQKFFSCTRPRVPGHRLNHLVTASAAASGHVADRAGFAGPQAILDRYRALLHEYRQHKAALGDWLGLVLQTKHRQAQLLDAEATGDAALVSRFQQYLMIRKRLLAEIPLMREQLGDAEQQLYSHSSSSSSSTEQHHKRHNSRSKHSSSNSSTGSFGVLNANAASPVSKSQAVGQFFAAVNYRSKHGVRGADASSSTTSNSNVGVSEVAPAIVAQEQPSPSLAASEVTVVSPALNTNNSSSNVHASPSATTGKTEALAHLLSSATEGASATSSSSRATAAALAALAYKKQKQSGGSAAGAAGGIHTQQQRPLAIQLAEAPPPPPGYAADGTKLDGSSSDVVIGVVETARADANALRSNRHLESDVSLEATLQGVPGGIGAADTAMFAATLTSPAAAAAATAVNVSSSGGAAQTASMDPVLAAAAAKASSSSGQPAGEVVTAKFDVYSGRRRVLDVDALDDYFASLVEGHSMQLAAAAAANTSSSAAAGGSVVAEPQQAPATSSSSAGSSSKAVQPRAGRRTGLSSSSSGDSGSALPDLGLPVEVFPVPT